MTTTDSPSMRTVGDGQGRTLEYVVRPALDPPNAPTIVVFHGAAFNQQPSKLASPSWNVISPLDRTGDDGQGSDWVGRSDDPFLIDLVCRAIADARASFGGDRGLYTWGTSIGGFGALLYGILCDATAVRCMLPTVRLWGVPYRKSHREERNLIRAGAGKGPYDDLVELVRTGVPWRMPFISIVENRWDGARLHEEHSLDLVAACAERGVGFHLEVLPQSGHFPLEAAYQGMEFFERFQENIARYRHTPHPATTTPQRFATSRASWGQARNESVERGRAFAELGLGLDLASSGGPWPEGAAGPGLDLVERWASGTHSLACIDDLVAAHRTDGDDRFLDLAGLVIHEWSMRFLEQDRRPFACSPIQVPSVAARIHVWARFVTYSVQAAPAWAAANPRILERVVSGIRLQGAAVAATIPARLGGTRRETRKNLLDQLAVALADDPPLLELAVAGDTNQVDDQPATDQRADAVDAPPESTGRVRPVDRSPAKPSSPQLSAAAAAKTDADAGEMTPRA